MSAAGDIFLDTNIAVALLVGESNVRKLVAEAGSVLLSTIVVGELYYGARHSARSKQNIQRIDDFASASSVCEPSVEAAKHYGSIKQALRNRGTPVSDNDIWIAAMAMQYDAFLATRDEHFKHIAGLKLLKW